MKIHTAIAVNHKKADTSVSWNTLKVILVDECSKLSAKQTTSMNNQVIIPETRTRKEHDGTNQIVSSLK